MAVPISLRHQNAHGDLLPVISVAAPPHPGHAREKHIVAIVGPGMEHVARCLADQCRWLGLSLRMLHTDSDDFNAAAMDEMHASGALGPATQLIVMGHGLNQSGKHQIETICRGPDAEGNMHTRKDDTLILLKWLRLGQGTDPQTAERLPWKGMIHMLSCGAGILGELIAESEDAQEYGPNLIYGNLTHHGVSETTQAIRSICEFIHLHRTEAVFSPTALLAWVGRTAAVPVTLAGGELRSPIVLEPARSVVEAMPAFLSGRLRQLAVARSHDAASALADREALRCAGEAMSREDVRLDSLLLEENLSRIMHEQVLNGGLDTVAELLNDVPTLVDVTGASGKPLEAVVDYGRRKRYEKLACKARKKCRRAQEPVRIPAEESGKESAGGAWSGLRTSTRGEKEPGITGRAQMGAVNGVPVGCRSRRAAVLSPAMPARAIHDPQSRLLAAAVRRIVQEPGYAAVLLRRACAQADARMFAALYQTAGLAPFRNEALIRSCSNEFMPPLHLACLIDAPELAAVLLENGAGVNQADHHGNTALHYAVESKSLALVKVLAGANADAAIRSQRVTPVELAAKNGFDAGFAELATSGFWQRQALPEKPLSAQRAVQRPDS